MNEQLPVIMSTFALCLSKPSNSGKFRRLFVTARR
jgi:hypothetical protein